jgi:hypothetical protein
MEVLENSGSLEKSWTSWKIMEVLKKKIMEIFEKSWKFGKIMEV